MPVAAQIIMENNIFEGAKFGDKFLTRDNSIGLFVPNDSFPCIFLLKGKYNITEVHRYNSEGEFYLGNGEYGHAMLDIVSKYQEPIDEEKLEELATKECWKNMDWYHELYCDGFKAGYRKAKKE